MKKSAKVVLLASLFSIGLFQSSVSAVTVTKSYRYDWNTVGGYSTNYHNHQYAWIPSWSRYDSYDDYKVGPIGILFVMRSLTTTAEAINR